jgi:hypothetical protein
MFWSYSSCPSKVWVVIDGDVKAALDDNISDSLTPVNSPNLTQSLIRTYNILPRKTLSNFRLYSAQNQRFDDQKQEKKRWA